ncbi:MAG TPA: hypothetical protein VKA38_12680 [Draconibacterium sp.]|nr:hypothetical protein [Draconibacterium sp.]
MIKRGRSTHAMLVAIMSNFRTLVLGGKHANGLDAWGPKILMESG